MDKGSVIGALIAAGAILLGLMLEGGKVGQVLPTHRGPDRFRRDTGRRHGAIFRSKW